MISARTVLVSGLLTGTIAFGTTGSLAQDSDGGPGCDTIEASLPQSVHTILRRALNAAAPNQARTGGLGNNMWGAVVDQNGIVCAIANTGNADVNDQWLGSRAIAAQKANTAVLFSLNAGAGGTVDVLSTANLYSAVQPGGSLFGLQFSNPVDPAVAYGDNAPGDQETSQGADTTAPPNYGASDDPLVGEYIGGINVFGGGLTLYDGRGNLLGGLGVSGDTSCADHNIAWIVRDTLGLDFVPLGVNSSSNATAPDNIIFDIVGEAGNFQSKSGFGHPICGFGADEQNPTIVDDCPTGDGRTDGCIG